MSPTTVAPASSPAATAEGLRLPLGRRSDGGPLLRECRFDRRVHPQTILAYALNDTPLDVAHGAPLRLRVERQLSYKHAKYLIEAVDSFAGFAGGKGGFWEDRGFEWYAGI